MLFWIFFRYCVSVLLKSLQWLLAALRIKMKVLGMTVGLHSVWSLPVSPVLTLSFILCAVRLFLELTTLPLAYTLRYKWAFLPGILFSQGLVSSCSFFWS